MPWAQTRAATDAVTRREDQISLLAAGGRTDAAIATELGISVHTVQNHLASACTKLGLNSRHDFADALFVS